METIRAPRGTKISCKGWLQEAALRMLMNNLDPDVAEKPEELIVYGGRGKAARNEECYHAIVKSLKTLENDETLLIQSGKPVGVFKTHNNAPRVLLANSNLVGNWATWEHFDELEKKLKKEGITVKPMTPAEIKKIDSIHEYLKLFSKLTANFLNLFN